MAVRAFGAISLLAMLAACGTASEEEQPGAPSPLERRALDDAAEMIEAQRLPEAAIPPTQAPRAAPPAPATQGQQPG